VFKKFMPPVALYGLLGLIMWLAKPERRAQHEAVDLAHDQASTRGNGYSPPFQRERSPRSAAVPAEMEEVPS
jgi:hypothetical protein